jgi:thioredoxin reductase (NADPH)
MNNIEKTVIIGSGPAGYTAAIYASRAMLEPLLITGFFKGGQLMMTTDIENFPGYVYGVKGNKMMNDLYEQSERFGTKFIEDEVNEINTKERPFVVKTKNNKIIKTQSIIIATGAKSLWLNAEGEEELKGNGVSTCATCDGAFFKDEEILVIGGGDSAMEEATFLTKYAKKVTIIHRREKFKASKIMLDRAKENDKIFWKTNFIIKKWITDEEGDLIKAILENTINGEKEEIDCTGAFIAIGHKPNVDFLNNQIETDEDGYIIHKENTMTSVPGIFSCGDICESSKRYKQAITAAGEGCKAAMDCEKWLEKIM